MYVCMCVCMYVCMCECVYIRLCVRASLVQLNKFTLSLNAGEVGSNESGCNSGASGGRIDRSGDMHRVETLLLQVLRHQTESGARRLQERRQRS